MLLSAPRSTVGRLIAFASVLLGDRSSSNIDLHVPARLSGTTEGLQKVRDRLQQNLRSTRRRPCTPAIIPNAPSIHCLNIHQNRSEARAWRARSIFRRNLDLSRSFASPLPFDRRAIVPMRAHIAPSRLRWRCSLLRTSRSLQEQKRRKYCKSCFHLPRNVASAIQNDAQSAYEPRAFVSSALLRPTAACARRERSKSGACALRCKQSSPQGRAMFGPGLKTSLACSCDGCLCFWRPALRALRSRSGKTSIFGINSQRKRPHVRR